MPALDVRILRRPIDDQVWAPVADQPDPVDQPAIAPVAVEVAPITPIVTGATAFATNRVLIASDPLAELLDRPLNDEISPILRARCDDVARRIVRDGGQVSIAGLAREVGCAPITMKRLMAHRVFRDVYNEVSDELMGTIDDRIANERLSIVVRQESLQQRAMTVLSEALALSQQHARNVVDNGAILRPGIIKTGIEAATEIRQIGTARAGVGGGAASTSVNINITRNHATVIQGAMRESGIDLSDVLGDVFTQPTTLIEKAG